jgi:hypothetical protein
VRDPASVAAEREGRPEIAGKWSRAAVCESVTIPTPAP